MQNKYIKTWNNNNYKIKRCHESWEMEHLNPRKLLLLVCPMNTSSMSQYRKIYTF